MPTIGDFEVIEMPADTKPENLFDGIPYRPNYIPPLPEDQLSMARQYMFRLRLSVADLNRRLITPEIYNNERYLALMCKRLKSDDCVSWTPEQALDRASREDCSRDCDSMIKLAVALEARQKYTYRLF